MRPSTKEDNITAKELMRALSSTKTIYKPLPGYDRSHSSWDRCHIGLDCDEVHPNIFIGDA